MRIRRLGLAGLVSAYSLGAVLLLCGSSALAARGHVFGGSFGKVGSGEGEFSEPSGIAVSEASGDVYVVDKGNNRVERFTSAGAYVSQFNGSGSDLAVEGTAAPTGRFSSPESIAVDNDASNPSYGDLYVADTGHKVIDKFSATGEYIVQLKETSGGSSFGGIDGIAVGQNGMLWVSQSSSEIDGFSNDLTNEFLSSFSAAVSGQVNPGFAVDSNDNFYIKGYYSGISKVDSSGDVLVEQFDNLINEPNSPVVPSGVAVDLSSDDVYIDDANGEGAVGRFTSAGSLVESFGSEHLIDGTGVTVDSTTGTVYVADSSADAVDLFPIEPPAAPKVEDQSILDVASGSATFSAKVNPRGRRTEYRFEYGPTTAYGESSPIPDALVGSDFGAAQVSAHPQDLLPQTLYHVRVVAHSELGSVDGEDLTFTTQPLGGELSLPDGRAWEIVSPPSKEGADIFLDAEVPLQAAVDGSAITYVTNVPTEPQPQGNVGGGPVGGVRVLSSRSGASWSSLDIEPPYKEAPGVTAGQGEEYKFFSTDLAYGLIVPIGGFNPLSPEATERTPYLRSNYAKGEDHGQCASSCYRPLVTASNVPPGTVFGGKSGETLEPIEFVGATSDLSHVLLRSNSGVALTSMSMREQLYEWSDGRLQLVSVLPSSEGGGPALEVVSNGDAMHAISSDGRRIFWWSHSNGNALYMRDTLAQETIRLDVADGGATNTELWPARFQIASGDGSRAFFTDAERLTEDSTVKEGLPDLYVSDVNAQAGERLTDLTVDHNSGEAANVQGVAGGSDDGSYIYFVAEGVLAPGATAGRCAQHAPGATCNLYVSHNNGHGWERPKLVAVLSAEDLPDWSSSLSRLTARVSPDGRYLSFMSNRRLTDYDTRDAVSGNADEEVYLYDAQAGKLVCASCNPTGARPSGVEVGLDRLINGARVWEQTRWLAANIPGWTGYDLSGSQYQARYLDNRGRLFFNSSDALVPQDVNATEDVYQYEPISVGSCTTANTTYNDLSGGCVSLISSGISPNESVFLDASETGGDVFFLTTAKLVSQDFDAGSDVYDAHECTSTVPCSSALVPPPPCSTGDSCKAAPSPQPGGLGPPSSATFAGAGNVTTPPPPKVARRSLSRVQKLSRALKVCTKKSKRKQRVACERLAKKRYGKAAVVKANKPTAIHRRAARTGR